MAIYSVYDIFFPNSLLSFCKRANRCNGFYRVRRSSPRYRKNNGYKGCKGVGEKGARDAFARMQLGDSIWRTALALFEKAGHDEAYALQQFRLARVLRAGEYDPKTGGLTLWTPPAATKQSKKARR